MRRKLFFATAGVIGVSLLGIVAFHTRAKVPDSLSSGDVHVVLTEAGFEPAQLRIAAGTKVIFSTTRSNAFWPASNPHPVHSLYPQFDPKHPIEPSDSWSFTFTSKGRFDYHDHIRSYFTGTIYVE